MTLTDQQAHIIIGALRVAHDVYLADAARTMDVPRVCETFIEQANNVAALADLMEDGCTDVIACAGCGLTQNIITPCPACGTVL